MSQKHREIDELMELLLRNSADGLSSDQKSRLNELLAVPKLAIAAAEFLDLQSGLSDARPADWSQVQDESTWQMSSRRRDSGILNTMSTIPYVLAALVASHLLVSVAVWYAATRSASEKVVLETPALIGPDLVAPQRAAPQLVAMTACVWSPSTVAAPAIGRSIGAGETLHLLEGIAELELGLGERNRARVRMEGPGSVVTNADSRLDLKFGVITADVSCQEGSFAINMPACHVLVHDQASIGIISKGAQNEVHVFQGDVTIESYSGEDQDATVHLSAGEAVSLVTSSGDSPNVTVFEASQSSFASAHSMAFDQLKIGQDYRDLIKEAGPAINWQFEASDDETGVSSKGQLKDFNAFIHGSMSWRRYGQNRVAEFGLTGTVGSFVTRRTWPPQPLDSYTIELWAKPSHFHTGALICLVEPTGLRGGRNPHGMFLEIGGEFDPKSKNPRLSDVRFVHRSVPSVNRFAGTSVVASTAYQARTWQHIVARKDQDRLGLFINGRLAAEDSDPLPLSENLQVVIGQLFPTLIHRPFVGQIDEVAIYEHALTDEEILRHFETVRPLEIFTEKTVDVQNSATFD